MISPDAYRAFATNAHAVVCIVPQTKDIARTIGITRTTKSPAPPGIFACVISFLPLHVDQRLQHLVGDRDDLRVALETALGDDHVGNLPASMFIRHNSFPNWNGTPIHKFFSQIPEYPLGQCPALPAT